MLAGTRKTCCDCSFLTSTFNWPANVYVKTEKFAHDPQTVLDSLELLQAVPRTHLRTVQRLQNQRLTSLVTRGWYQSYVLRCKGNVLRRARSQVNYICHLFFSKNTAEFVFLWILTTHLLFQWIDKWLSYLAWENPLLALARIEPAITKARSKDTNYWATDG